MTDKAESGTPEVVTDLTTLGGITGVMTRPKNMDVNDLAGTEGITPEDVRLPRLGIAQGLSHQMTPGDTMYIEGLKLFEMFNDLTTEVYGKGPLTFVPVRRDVRRLEFRPRKEGGGLLDPDVPPRDPRLDWRRGAGPNGEDLPPSATTFVEFVVLLLRPGKAPEPIVMSIAGTNKHNRRASDQLTTFIKLRGTAIYTGLYTVDTNIPAKNDKGTFGVFTIKNAGFIPTDTPAGAALLAYAKEFHDSIEGKKIVIEREPGDDSFDTESMEADSTRTGQTVAADM